MVSVIVYVPPGAHSPMLSFTATSANPAAFRVDRIYLSRVGRNFGCLALNADNRLVNLDQLQASDSAAVPETYPAFSVDADGVLGSSVTINLGAVSNIGKWERRWRMSGVLLLVGAALGSLRIQPKKLACLSSLHAFLTSFYFPATSLTYVLMAHTLPFE